MKILLRIILCLFPTFGICATNCQPIFSFKNGWLGGDAAYSIALPTGKTLWLFGDTFIGLKKNLSRKHATIIANSIGLASCNQNKWKMHYIWRVSKDKNPQAFFQTHNSHLIYWPQAGFYYANKIYLVLDQVRRLPNKKTFGFVVKGVTLAIIADYNESPQNWNIRYIKLNVSHDVFPGAAI